ncbi:hypothetical protein [uncultured Amphritea sp.]|uniref:hypothetical protein n=1 Tax=uncultured Amphritea sp. TaxID=981605 RepID=UPI002637E9B3|nr:hypothetical protein [uncultured Amphritea sp.]
MDDDHNKPAFLDGNEASIEPDQDIEPAFRRLTPDEITNLRREAAEAGAWMRAELALRKKGGAS